MAARSSTLAENVAAALRHAIFHGAYTSGERLVELSIAQEMHVSQNTVRDALRLLEQEGLVIKRARYGTRIRSYSEEEAAEIYGLWAAVESLALQAALKRLDAAGRARLWDIIEHYQNSLIQGHIQQAQDLRFQFHMQLAQASARPLTQEILLRLYNQVRLLETSHPLPSTEEKQIQINLYMQLMEAISQDDAAAAQAALYQCIKS